MFTGHFEQSLCSPLIKPKWLFLNGSLVTSEMEGFGLENHGKSLRIDVTLDKAGGYKCSFGPIFHVEVEGCFFFLIKRLISAAPHWVGDQPCLKRAMIGEDVVLNCSVEALPAPEFIFYKNGISLCGFCDELQKSTRMTARISTRSRVAH